MCNQTPPTVSGVYLEDLQLSMHFTIHEPIMSPSIFVRSRKRVHALPETSEPQHSSPQLKEFISAKWQMFSSQCVALESQVVSGRV